MTREDIVDNVRTLARQYNVKPIPDEAIFNAIERAIDDVSNKCPFLMAVDRGNSVLDQQEYLIAVDILEVLEVFYQDAAGSTLATAIDTDDLTVVCATDISTFPDSGSLKIGSEILTYTSKVDATMTFTISARGAQSTTAAAHSRGVGVIEYGSSPVRLDSTSPRRLGDTDASYIEGTSGVPSSFYIFSGVLGFDIPTDKNGYHNIIIRSFVRPPLLVGDDSVISGLLETFNNSIVNYCVAKVLQMLGQDQQTIIQANMFMSDYISSLTDFKKIKHLYIRNDSAQIRPFTGR